MLPLLLSADDLLRAGLTSPYARLPRLPALKDLILLILLFGLSYGAVMGTFTGFAPDRAVQILYSAVKVPLLLLATFLLSLPSFFVLNTLLGLRADFPESLRALMATQAGLTIILSSLAPFTLLFYASSDHYQMAQLFNAAMFAIASFTAQLLLKRLYAPLIARDRRHRWLVRAWLLVYAFVGIQMAWVLRPFIGKPEMSPTFFREEAFTNAYQAVLRIISHVAAG
jgi:hypothetical protein